MTSGPVPSQEGRRAEPERHPGRVAETEHIGLGWGPAAQKPLPISRRAHARPSPLPADEWGGRARKETERRRSSSPEHKPSRGDRACRTNGHRTHRSSPDTAAGEKCGHPKIRGRPAHPRLRDGGPDATDETRAGNPCSDNRCCSKRSCRGFSLDGLVLGCPGPLLTPRAT